MILINNFTPEYLDSIIGDKVEQDYLNGMTSVKIAQKYLQTGKRYGNILSLLKYRGVSIKNYSQASQIYDRNSDYFKTWSHEMAYILGFIATDGSVHKNELKISLKINDKDFLENLLRQISSEIPIIEREIHLKTNNKNYPICEIVIRDKEICKDLFQLGITENKTFTLGRFDFIPPEYEKDFILGVMDGDGSIGQIGGNCCKNSIQIRLRLVSASYDFIEYIRDIMVKHGMKKVNITSSSKNRKHVIYEIAYSTKEAIKFYYEFYNENTKLFLPRKYNTLKNLVNKRIEYENSKKNTNILKVSAKK